MIAVGFTSQDWFQLAYPFFWFLLGVLTPRRDPPPSAPSTQLGAHQTANLQGNFYGNVSVKQLVVQPMPDTASAATSAKPPAARGPRGSSTSNNNSNTTPAVLGAGFIAMITLAWAYLEFRGLLLGIAVAFACFTLGLLLRETRRRIARRELHADFAVAAAVEGCLVAVACASVYLLLHPPAAIPGYDAIFDAYRAEGLGALSALDDTTPFLALQCAGALALIAAAFWTLWFAVGLLAKALAMRGLTLRWHERRALQTVATAKGTIVSLASIVLLLAVSFLSGSGYGFKFIQDQAGDTNLAGAPVILDPKGVARSGYLRVTYVATRSGHLRLAARDLGSGHVYRTGARVKPGRNATQLRVGRAGRRTFSLAIRASGASNEEARVRRLRVST